MDILNKNMPDIEKKMIKELEHKLLLTEKIS